MTQVYVEFIKSILETINFSYEKEQYDAVGATEQYNALFVEKEALVKGNYQWIKSNGLVDGLLEFLKNEYGDDDEVYLTLLDYIFGIVRDVKFEVKYMERRLEKEISEGADALTLINLDMQIRSFSWQNNMKIDFCKQWEINKILGDKLKQEIVFYCDRIPLEDRDENVVVVLTSQILNIKHAPTRLVFDTCYRLKKILNKDVLIVNIAQYANAKKLQEVGVVYANSFNVYEEYNGQKEYEYKDILIPMYQVVLDEDRLIEIKEVLEFIYNLKPFCIWNIATQPAVLGLTNQITTSIYTDCTEGYAPVRTDIFYNYFPNSSENSMKNRIFLENADTVIIDKVFIGEKQELHTELTKEVIGIPKDAFLLCVAGNRLSNDCDAVFLNLIDKVMERNQKVHLMVIGKVTEEFVENNTKDLKNASRIHFLGFRKDFLECMSLMDLYVNTFGMGGGNAGNNALFLGKPIVTLNKGDIYSFAGDEFAVNTVDEYVPIINKYISDKEFYMKQCQLAREKYENLAANDEKLAAVMKVVLDKVR